MQKNWKKIIIDNFLIKKLRKIDLYCVPLQADKTIQEKSNEKYDSLHITIFYMFLGIFAERGTIQRTHIQQGIQGVYAY